MITPTFHNPGVNYAVAGVDWAADAKIFKNGRRFPNYTFPLNIVCNNALVSIPWSIGSSNNNGNFADARNAAIFFASDPAFEVTFNLFYGPTTRDSWAQATTAMVAEATYLQAQGKPIEISIGNEISGTYGLNYGIVSLTQSAGIATLVAASPFKTHIGDTITIYGSNRVQYNSTFTILSTDGNKTMTFAVDPATVNPGNGTLISMEYSEFWGLALQTAVAIKAVYAVGKVSIAEFDGITHGVDSYSVIASMGTGVLDHVAAHVYPALSGNPGYVRQIALSANSNAVVGLIAALGPDKITIGEFNLTAGSLTGLSNESNINGMRRMFLDLNSFGVKRITTWSWNTNLAMRNQATGIYNPSWGVLASNNGRIVPIMLNQVRSTVTRTPIVRSGVPARTPV